MRKQVFGRRLKRDKNQRKALFRSLLSSLVLNGSIKTTEAKAKAIKADADKIIKKAKKQEHFARKLLGEYLFPPAVDKLIAEVAPRFTQRKSGFTRIIKLGKRVTDSAPLVLMEWVEEDIQAEEPVKTTAKQASKDKKVKKATAGQKKQTVTKAKTKKQ